MRCWRRRDTSVVVEQPRWSWDVEDVWAINARGVVVVGALHGPMPSTGMLVEIATGSGSIPATIAGLEVMRVTADANIPETWPRLLGDPVGLVLAGVAKRDVPVGATVGPRA
jgi:translation elongation factor EF-Tu-like GTPase